MASRADLRSARGHHLSAARCDRRAALSGLRLDETGGERPNCRGCAVIRCGEWLHNSPQDPDLRMLRVSLHFDQG